jgi:MoaA/NifB/PqqE/SkfB family radical SAM enzyme
MDRVFPRQVIIETSSLCQLRCKGCPINEAEGGDFISPQLYYSIIDRIVKEREETGWNPVVIPWLNGEPLLNPNLYDYLKYLTLHNLKSYITTNGMVFDPKVFGLITEKNSIYQLIFSLDGLPFAESKSIEKARPGSDRGKILDTIRRVAELKIIQGNHIDLAVKIVHRGQDYEEIENYIYYWLNQPGIDYVCVGKMLDEDTVDDMRIYPCRYSDPMFLVIRHDGDIVPCAYNDAVVNGKWFTRNAKWPNVGYDKPLLELYNTGPIEEFRKEQHEGRFYGPCQTCGFAYTGHGFRGVVEWRDVKKQDGRRLWYHSDHYNSFYSYKCSMKDDSFYRYYKDISWYPKGGVEK